jgi:hypothetical protein
MKRNKTIVNPYFIIAVFLAIVFSQTVPKVFSYSGLHTFSKDLILSFFTGITFRYILSANDNRNRVILKTQENNDEIKESNEDMIL